MSKRKILIDTDAVADDIRAISVALQHPNVEVVGITTVRGCVEVEQAVANVARTLKANGKTNIPIYKGCSAPFIGNFDVENRERAFFGQDGLGDAPDEFPQVTIDDWSAHVPNEHAAVALTRVFEKDRDLVLVCIGPLTNIAMALKLQPEFAKWPKKIVIMGGNIHAMGNVTAKSTAEFNFSYDPEAAHIVLKEMRCEKILIPWETFVMESNKKSVDFHEHLTIDHPLARYFEMATRTGRKVLEQLGRQFSYCDEICVAVAIDPEEIIESEKVIKGTVELHGTYTRGQVALAWVDSLDPECTEMNELRFVMTYNAKNLDALIHKTIHRCPDTQKEKLHRS